MDKYTSDNTDLEMDVRRPPKPPYSPTVYSSNEDSYPSSDSDLDFVSSEEVQEEGEIQDTSSSEDLGCLVRSSPDHIKRAKFYVSDQEVVWHYAGHCLPHIQLPQPPILFSKPQGPCAHFQTAMDQFHTFSEFSPLIHSPLTYIDSLKAIRKSLNSGISLTAKGLATIPIRDLVARGDLHTIWFWYHHCIFFQFVDSSHQAFIRLPPRDYVFSYNPSTTNPLLYDDEAEFLLEASWLLKEEEPALSELLYSAATMNFCLKDFRLKDAVALLFTNGTLDPIPTSFLDLWETLDKEIEY